MTTNSSNSLNEQHLSAWINKGVSHNDTFSHLSVTTPGSNKLNDDNFLIMCNHVNLDELSEDELIRYILLMQERADFDTVSDGQA